MVYVKLRGGSFGHVYKPFCVITNELIFATGPLTGTGAPGSGSIEVCFKSPLTGIWGEARAGGEWGSALKKAGYDFLVIEGKAKEAKYIMIHDGKVEIRPAKALKGKSSSQKEELLKMDDNCVMMKAVDWDNDGDMDLVLSGRKIGAKLCINEGSKTKARTTCLAKLSIWGRDSLLPDSSSELINTSGRIGISSPNR